MDAARQLAQVLQRGRQLGVGPLDQRGGLAVAVHTCLEQPQVDGEGHELLLRSVVQVALQPPPRGVGGLDYADPRRAQVLEACAQVGLELLVVEGQCGGRRRGLHQLGPGVEIRVVNDRRDPPAAAVHGRPR